MPEKHAPQPNRINNVQALRGFAALLVVLGHTEFALPGMQPFGTFGVDIFFVISGFIMAMIVDRNSEKFFLRRLIRILPLYWTATLGVFALAAFTPRLMMHTRANWGELALSLLFIPFFKNGATMNANPILFVGWTLNYEMFFYVVLAICLAFTRKHATLIAGAIIALTLVICRPFGNRTAITLLYGYPIILEFPFGIAAYWLVRRMSLAQTVRLRRPAAFAVAAAALLMISFQGTSLWPRISLHRLFLFGVPSFVLVGSAALLSKSGWDTRSRLLVLLGDASYVMYILHTYILDGFDRVLARRAPALAIHHPAGCVISVALAIVVSIAVYLWAEKPVVDWLSDKFGTRRIPRAEVKDPAQSMA